MSAKRGKSTRTTQLSPLTLDLYVGTPPTIEKTSQSWTSSSGSFHAKAPPRVNHSTTSTKLKARYYKYIPVEECPLRHWLTLTAIPHDPSNQSICMWMAAHTSKLRRFHDIIEHSSFFMSSEILNPHNSWKEGSYVPKVLSLRPFLSHNALGFFFGKQC